MAGFTCRSSDLLSIMMAVDGMEDYDYDDVEEAATTAQEALQAKKDLYAIMSKTMGGKAHVLIKNTVSGDGFEAWHKVLREYDPRNALDKNAAYAQVASPEKRATSDDQLKEFMTEWEAAVNKYEVRWAPLPDETKVSAIVFDCPVQGIAAETAGNRTDKNAFGIKAFEQNAESLVDFANNVLRPKIDFVEKQLPLCFRGRNAHWNVLLLHALGFQVDHKQGEAIGFLLNLGMRCRSRHHQRVVRAIGVGDKCLLTAQREAIATLLCYRGSTNRVGSRVRLGDREAKARLPATRIAQIA